MTGEQLKNSILQEAIEGKLVPQDPNDEPASKLLERISKEKESLVKAKKIKRDNNESRIYCTPDGHYVERFYGKRRSELCIDDEIPFEIPKGWEWCRLRAIGDWGAGATPQRGESLFYKDGTIPWIKTGELNNGVINSSVEKVTQLALDKCSLRACEIGDVLIAMYGATIGKLAIAGIKLTTNQACCACTPLSGIYNWYLFYFLMASKQSLIKLGEGGAQPNISRDKIINYLFPLPPLEEQKRIVAKIEELKPYVERFGKAQTELDNLNKRVRPLLKKSVVQEAIEGKLVPQDPNDEPASKLLERIRKEKAQLAKEGKLKKAALVNSDIYRGDDDHWYEKSGKTITDISDEIPFDIPETWKWCRIERIFQLNPKNEAKDDLEAGFIPMEKIEAGYGSSYSYAIKEWGQIKKGFTHFADGDVAFAKITPCFQNRKSAIFKDLPNGIGAGTTELKVLRPYGESIDRYYVLYFLESPYFIEEATFKGTANQQRIITGYLENKLFPLPPLEEQKRIVAKIEEVFALLQ